MDILFSLLGFGQKHSAKVSDRRTEAYRLNAEIENLLNRCLDTLKIEQLRLHHRCDEVFPDDPELFANCEAGFNELRDGVELGLVTVGNSQEAIKRSSSFASLSKWDETLLILHKHHGASERMMMSIDDVLKHVHDALDKADVVAVSELNIEVPK